MPMTTRLGARRQAKGYALLEALIAVLVTAIGFVGAARMQTSGMAMTNSAQTRQKASLLAYQMADRVRANKRGADAGAYNAVATGSTTCLTAGGGCSPAALAVADYTEWLQQDVQNQLKNGDGKVCLVTATARTTCNAAGDFLAVILTWEDSVGASSLSTTVCHWTPTASPTYCQ
jgi:type IV pilus assembly protein PilV